MKAPLREFVYLDEVSVFSLLASRTGPIATEFTKTEAFSLKADAGGFIGSSVETGSQVLRKSTIQTTFKDLYELERTSFAIRPMDETLKPPAIATVNDLMTRRHLLMTEGWVIDPENLVRGKLLEVEVQLEAEDIFRVREVISAVLEIIEENPAMFGIDPGSNIALVKSFGRMLEKLLVGLVPVSGHAIDYEVVSIEEKEWIVHRKLLNQLSKTELLPRRLLYVVGVAEQPLFWRDVRRILFSKARFRVLCRLAEDRIQHSWRPVKLAHVLDLIVPGLGNQIDSLGSGVLASIIRASKTEPRIDRQQQMREALVSYARLFAERYGQSITEQELVDAGVLTEQQCNSYGGLMERREAFNAIATFLIQRFGIEREPMVIAECRAEALEKAGLGWSGPSPSFAPSDNVPAAVSSGHRFLDSEFVAIYW